MSTLINKTAFVTGGSRGIGAGIVRRLASDGADVAFTYVSGADKADELVKEIEKTGRRVIAIQADSANADAIITAVDKAAAELGKIDILVNNAGVGIMGTLDNFSLADFDKTMNINVRAVFVATQQVLKHMGAGGRIITIGSTNADKVPFQGGSVYAMSKAAIKGFTIGLSRDLGPLGITVNNIQPGPVNTDLNPEDGEFASFLKTQIPVGRYAQTDEIGGLVSYLAGPESGYINGANINIDGGFLG